MEASVFQNLRIRHVSIVRRRTFPLGSNDGNDHDNPYHVGVWHPSRNLNFQHHPNTDGKLSPFELFSTAQILIVINSHRIMIIEGVRYIHFF